MGNGARPDCDSGKTAQGYPAAERIADANGRRTKAEAKLATDREAHAAKVARELAELEEKAARLRSKEISLMGRESMAERTLARETADRLNRARPLSEAATISQEPA
jgi:chromosome segregation ATPase